MSTVSFLLSVLACLLALLFLEPHPAPASPAIDRSEFAVSNPTFGDRTGRGRFADGDADSGPAEDVRGNDVDAAVARYQVDTSGNLYEEHSPQTEIPRLPAAKS
jgi:hypothetical protein